MPLSSPSAGLTGSASTGPPWARWLRRHRFNFLGAGLFLAIVLADWRVIEMGRVASIAAYQTAMTKLASGMAAQTTRNLGQVDATLRDLKTELERDGGRAWDSKINLPSRRLALRYAAMLAIVNAEGVLTTLDRAGMASQLAVGADFSGRADFRHFAAVADTAPYAGPPWRDPDSGRWFMPLARRVNGPHGTFGGLVIAEISLGALEDFYRVAVPSNRTVMLALPDGKVVARFPFMRDVIGAQVPAGSVWYRLVAQGGGEFLARDDFNHRPVVGQVRKLPDLPYIIEATVDEDEVLAGWRVQRWWLIGGAACAIGLMLGLLRLFVSQLNRMAAQNAALDKAHAHLDAAMGNISQGLCLFDGEQRLIMANKQFAELYHLQPQHLQAGTTLREIMEASFAVCAVMDGTVEDFIMARAAVARCRVAHQSVLMMADGRTLSIQQQPMPDGGWVATHEDITERKRAEERVSFLAQHDSLTGLANRSLLRDLMAQAAKNAGRGRGFAVLFLDLDRFKAVNDTLGHGVGDALLREVAARLQATVREVDAVARLGGDEFVVLQAGVQTPEDAAVLAGRIIMTVAAPYKIEGHQVEIGVSIGIDICLEKKISADIMLKNADTALYMSKAERRGVFRFFEPDMDAGIQARNAFEREMRGALQRGEFELYYQPIIDGVRGHTVGFEALLRWNHPTRGVVGPQDFIAIAEESGLIIPIGEWVLAQACRQAAGWPNHIHISVNLSPVQFRAANLVDMVCEAIEAAGLAAGRLELEITESTLLQSNEHNIAVMHKLRACGVSIAMDDFGTGYSSLSYLRSFPFDRIKIDRSFVRDLTVRADAIFLVRAIVGLCRDLGVKTTVEGVESTEQMALLLAEGCRELQGYLFSRPRPAARLGPLLEGAVLVAPPGAAAAPAPTAAAAPWAMN